MLTFFDKKMISVFIYWRSDQGQRNENLEIIIIIRFSRPNA